MGRLIDAMQTVIKMSGRITPLIQMGANPTQVYNEVLQVVAEAPTVDAVEVVRCRDCKWYMPGDLFTDIMFCHRLKKENGKPAKYNYCADDFCSYGEQKDGDGIGR